MKEAKIQPKYATCFKTYFGHPEYQTDSLPLDQSPEQGVQNWNLDIFFFMDLSSPTHPPCEFQVGFSQLVIGQAKLNWGWHVSLGKRNQSCLPAPGGLAVRRPNSAHFQIMLGTAPFSNVISLLTTFRPCRESFKKRHLELNFEVCCLFLANCKCANIFSVGVCY